MGNSETTWQPIESAPKDGSTIIGRGLNHGIGPECHLALVYWDDERHTPGFYDRAESEDRYVYLSQWCPVDIPAPIPRSSSGRTTAFEAVNRGSNPRRGPTPTQAPEGL